MYLFCPRWYISFLLSVFLTFFSLSSLFSLLSSSLLSSLVSLSLSLLSVFSPAILKGSIAWALSSHIWARLPTWSNEHPRRRASIAASRMELTNTSSSPSVTSSTSEDNPSTQGDANLFEDFDIGRFDLQRKKQGIRPFFPWPCRHLIPHSCLLLGQARSLIICPLLSKDSFRRAHLSLDAAASAIAGKDNSKNTLCHEGP